LKISNISFNLVIGLLNNLKPISLVIYFPCWTVMIETNRFRIYLLNAVIIM